MAAFCTSCPLALNQTSFRGRDPLVCGTRKIQISRASPRWSMMAKYQHREEPENKGDAGLLREIRETAADDPSAFTPISSRRENGNGKPLLKKKKTKKGKESEGQGRGISTIGSLPTLSSLGGLSQQPNIGPINEVEIRQEILEEKERLREESYKKSILEEDETWESFLLGVLEEIKLIEWPPFGKVLKIAVVVMGAITFSFVFIYVVDGFFSRLAELLFKTDMSI